MPTTLIIATAVAILAIGGGDGVRCISSDIGKWAWMTLRHTGTPRTIRPSRKPPMPDASRYRHSRIPN